MLQRTQIKPILKKLDRTQVDLAGMLEVTKYTLSKKIKGGVEGYELTDKELKKIEKILIEWGGAHLILSTAASIDDDKLIPIYGVRTHEEWMTPTVSATEDYIVERSRIHPAQIESGGPFGVHLWNNEMIPQFSKGDTLFCDETTPSQGDPAVFVLKDTMQILVAIYERQEKGTVVVSRTQNDTVHNIPFDEIFTMSRVLGASFG